jgi:hypothetical protein
MCDHNVSPKNNGVEIDGAISEFSTLVAPFLEEEF